MYLENLIYLAKWEVQELQLGILAPGNYHDLHCPETVSSVEFGDFNIIEILRGPQVKSMALYTLERTLQ